MTCETDVTHWISHFQAPLGQLEALLLTLDLGFLGQGWLWAGWVDRGAACMWRKGAWHLPSKQRAVGGLSSHSRERMGSKL